MNDASAIPTDFAFTEVPPEVVEEQAKTIERRKSEPTIVEHPGWPLFREAVLARARALRTLEGVDTRGMSVAEVGERFLAASTAADELTGILAGLELEHGARTDDA